MRSMTGYGKSVVEIDGRKCTLEMKSVNHRFLDLSFRMPKTFCYLEDSLRKCISEKVERGHVDIFITYENNRDDENDVKLNEGLAKKYVNIAKELTAKYDIINDLAVTSLLRVPEVLTVVVAEENEEAITNLVLRSCNEAVDRLVDMRDREGAILVGDIFAKLDEISSLVDAIEHRAPLVVEDYKQKLTKRIEEILQEVSLDEAKLANEVAFFADKACIDEEIARLKTHILHLKEMLSSPNSLGRKMDFLVQEFNREANTIASKSNDSDITNNVLQLKTTIEKVREQIQNFE